MLFNSLEFLIFFPLVTALYFLAPQRWRTPLLLVASCAFYMAFVPVYILILAFTIVVDYGAGLWIERATGRARRWALGASLAANVGVLAIFKYYAFATANLTSLGHLVGLAPTFPMLRILLPIGLSFHTFQAMSYTIEVYRGTQRAERDFLTYALYVMFFPQLVAGPIERPQNLLHQFREHHRFDYARVTRGLTRMAVGMFKKVVLADTLALQVRGVYEHPHSYHALTLLVATVLFAFRIYWDFSGYSDIALGGAEVLGFRLMENFRTPYFARSVGEFWRRWHISLSTWFKDYVYLPLGGSRTSAARHYANLAVVFLVSGLWHGANWTFVIWGALHATYLIVGDATRVARERALALAGLTRDHPVVRAGSMMTTFALVTVAWVFFRSPTVGTAWFILSHLATGLTTSAGWSADGHAASFAACLALVAGAAGVEWAASRRREAVSEALLIFRMPLVARYATIYVLVYSSLLWASYAKEQFIYFQF